ncbi:ThiF family adenylyltransferase [Pelagicoccus enzymogenes]|uniref:HesA/MoeB/ThiF family protein n=1 Tax=Pelagicoccus enzymogenes TaxID=2773457 RepID=UPI00280DC6BC|nr:ThiF family adenylyltransferase [Pelagicoccus enzymogenes]MDQ8200984.1 ThiF family adenylyltransferase [Pelagicoccus enzymogenes]
MQSNDSQGESISLKESRFSRFESIDWWKQETLDSAKVLVVGAGALGNEVIKNLALLGVGHLAIVDMDRIEESNLSRSSLFRSEHEGEFKAERAAKSAKDLYPKIKVESYVGKIQSDIGYGLFRWADIVVGALDNREARIFVNRACTYVGRPWIDGGIDVLNGVARGFQAPQTACYECTMSKVDWDLIQNRQSCSLHARRALANRGVPTTPTTSSVIGAIQAQEVLKYLHGLESIIGKGFLFEGLAHNSYKIEYSINPACDLHYEQAEIHNDHDLSNRSTMRQIFQWGEKRLGKVEALDIYREIVSRTSCPQCGQVTECFVNAETIPVSDTFCSRCEVEKIPEYLHSLGPDSPYLDKTVSSFGLPENEILWLRNSEKCIGIDLTEIPSQSHV